MVEVWFEGGREATHHGQMATHEPHGEAQGCRAEAVAADWQRQGRRGAGRQADREVGGRDAEGAVRAGMTTCSRGVLQSRTTASANEFDCEVKGRREKAVGQCQRCIRVGREAHRQGRRRVEEGPLPKGMTTRT